MNNKTLKSFFSSKVFRILFALITIAIISTGVIIAIKTILTSLNPPGCPPGQTKIQGREGCYNNICSKECPANSHRDFSSKQAPECGDCICDDGYQNTSDTTDNLVCKKICGTMGPCHPGFSCVYFNNQLGCHPDNELETASQCEKSNVFCKYDYICNPHENNCIQNNPEPSSSIIECDSDKYETPVIVHQGHIPICDNVNGTSNRLNPNPPNPDSNFNKIRKNSIPPQPQLGFCDIPYKGGSQNRKCFLKGTSTIYYNNGTPELGFCNKPNNPSFDNSNFINAINCCNKEPCKNGMCPDSTSKCLPNGLMCSNNNVYSSAGELNCCENDNVYVTYNNPTDFKYRNCPKYSIYSKNDESITDCSSTGKCQGEDEKCIKLINKKLNPKQTFQCRVFCKDGELAVNNKCIPTNKCGWQRQSSNPLILNETTKGGTNINFCTSSVIDNENNNIFWKKYETGKADDKYTIFNNLQTPITNTCIANEPALTQSCAKLVDGKILKSSSKKPTLDVSVVENTKEKTKTKDGICNFTINCDYLRSGYNIDLPWEKQRIEKSNLSSIWKNDGTFSTNSGTLSPYNSSFTPINDIFLSNGLYCKHGTVDGVRCLSHDSKSININKICPIRTSPYLNNLNCSLSDGHLSCNKNDNKMTSCCGLGGFANKDSTNVFCNSSQHWGQYGPNEPFQVLYTTKLLDLSRANAYDISDQGKNISVPGYSNDYIWNGIGQKPKSFLTSILLENKNKYLNFYNNTLCITDENAPLNIIWGFVPYNNWGGHFKQDWVISGTKLIFNSVASRTCTFLGYKNNNKIVRLIRNENSNDVTSNSLSNQNPSSKFNSIQGIQIICNPSNNTECILVALALDRHQPKGMFDYSHIRVYQKHKKPGTVQIGKVDEKGNLIFNTEWQTGNELWPSQDILNNTTIFNIKLFISNTTDDNFVKSRSNNTQGFTTVMDLINTKPKISDIISTLQI